MFWFFTLAPVFNIGADVFQFCEDLSEEPGLGIDPQHGPTQAVDDIHAAFPKTFLVRLNEKRLQWVTDLVTHVARKDCNLL
jgi:hypothetical protein